MTIPLDETLLRAETLFHKFKRKIEVLDKKRLSPSLPNQQGEYLQEGLRKRKGKETAESNDDNSNDIGDNDNDDDNTNDSNNDNSASSSTVNNSNKKITAVHYSLRELLS